MVATTLFRVTIVIVLFSKIAFCDPAVGYLQDIEVLSNKDVSEKCNNSLSKVNIATKLKMIDSWGKLQSGILSLNLFSLGNFDECYGIEETIEDEKVFGKYCLSIVTAPVTSENLYKTLDMSHLIGTPRLAKSNSPSEGFTSLFYYGYCLLDACSADDFQKIIPLPIITEEESCYSKSSEPVLSTGAIATISVLGIFLGMLVMSTAYDVYLYYTEHEPRHYLLLAFSALSNGKKLFQSSKSPDQLLCLNGIKAISMMWVILGHSYSTLLGGPLDNADAISDFILDVKNGFLLSATLSVDTFLAVGGLVTVYAFLRASNKGVKFNIFMFYFHRYLRLTPPLIAMSFITAYVAGYMGNGPLWSAITTSISSQCKDYWWSSILYIQNYVNNDAMCLGQSWYLSVDFQLFLLSPFILLPLRKHAKIAVWLLFGLICLGIVIPFTVTYIYEVSAFYRNQGTITTNGKEYYRRTHTRFGPYVIGMLFGYIIYETKQTGHKLKLNFVKASLAWILIVAGLLACTYAGIPNASKEYNRYSDSLYLALNRNAWALGVCIVVYLCVTGYGGPINSFLSLPIFQFLTKISYSMYLVHINVILNRFCTSKTSIHFSNYYVFTNFWGDFMFTLFFALILCLTFESPIIILEKVIFGSGPSQELKKKKLPA